MTNIGILRSAVSEIKELGIVHIRNGISGVERYNKVHKALVAVEDEIDSLGREADILMLADPTGELFENAYRAVNRCECGLGCREEG